jgi:hypothetical protein
MALCDQFAQPALSALCNIIKRPVITSSNEDVLVPVNQKLEVPMTIAKCFADGQQQQLLEQC